MFLRRLALLSVLVLAACASQADDPTLEPSMTDSPTPEPSPTATARPTPSESPDADGETITGRLGFDDIEGGCPYLQTDDGTRYQVLWPDGWSLDGRNRLVNPDGDVVASGSDEVTVRGRVDDDMGSICQIGPIFRASEVVED